MLDRKMAVLKGEETNDKKLSEYQQKDKPIHSLLNQ